MCEVWQEDSQGQTQSDPLRHHLHRMRLASDWFDRKIQASLRLLRRRRVLNRLSANFNWDQETMSLGANDGHVARYQLADFHLTRHLPDSEGRGWRRRSAKADKQVDDHSFGRGDGEGGTVRLALWKHPGQGIYG